MATKTFNVLILGETQSGKSTLVEALKLYADPTYSINSSRIGTGNLSLTTEVRQESIHTQLPEYQLFLRGSNNQHHPQQDGQQPVIYDTFIKSDLGTYEDELNARHQYQPPVAGAPYSDDILEFNIIDTPGLNDTNDRDEDHVSKVLKALGGKSLSLVLVTVPRTALTQGLRQTLRSYMDLFPQLGDIIAFVHTRVDYLGFHPKKIDFQNYMEEKKAMLNTIMGRDSFPHFWIDCDFQTTKPIRKCVTNNTLRRILTLAVKNVPIAMLRSETVNKTPKMKEIDRIIKSQVQAVIHAIENTLEFKDREEGVLLREVYIRITEINELRARIKSFQELLKSYQTDELGLLYEQRFDDIRGPSAIDETLVADYSGCCKIDTPIVWYEHFKANDSEGTDPQTDWHCTFRKTNGDRNGYFHVKLYAKKNSRFEAEIEALSSNIVSLEAELQQRIGESKQLPKESISKIQSFVDDHNRHMEVIRLASAETLHRDLFLELVRDRAFAGPTSESSEKVATIYRKSAAKLIPFPKKPVPSPCHQEMNKARSIQVRATTPEQPEPDIINPSTVASPIHQPIKSEDQPPPLPPRHPHKAKTSNLSRKVKEPQRSTAASAASRVRREHHRRCRVTIPTTLPSIRMNPGYREPMGDSDKAEDIEMARLFHTSII